MTRHPEDHVQHAVISRLERLAPGVVCIHPANGGFRHTLEAMRLKSLGVLPGAPDLLCLFNDGSYGFIEVKAGRGALTPPQQAFRLLCRKRRIRWALIRNADEVGPVLHGWGVLDHDPGNGRIIPDLGERDTDRLAGAGA